MNRVANNREYTCSWRKNHFANRKWHSLAPRSLIIPLYTRTTNKFLITFSTFYIGIGIKYKIPLDKMLRHLPISIESFTASACIQQICWLLLLCVCVFLPFIPQPNGNVIGIFLYKSRSCLSIATKYFVNHGFSVRHCCLFYDMRERLIEEKEETLAFRLCVDRSKGLNGMSTNFKVKQRTTLEVKRKQYTPKKINNYRFQYIVSIHARMRVGLFASFDSTPAHNRRNVSLKSGYKLHQIPSHDTACTHVM